MAVWLRQRTKPADVHSGGVDGRGRGWCATRSQLRCFAPRRETEQHFVDAATDGAANDDLNFVPRLTDFGLAKVLEDKGDQTTTGVIMGSVPYMAPEQAEGGAAIGPATGYTPSARSFIIAYGPSACWRTLLATLEQVRSGQPAPLRRFCGWRRRQLGDDLSEMSAQRTGPPLYQRRRSGRGTAGDFWRANPFWGTRWVGRPNC